MGGAASVPCRGFPDVPAPEMGALNSGSVSWTPTCPGRRQVASCFPHLWDGGDWERRCLRKLLHFPSSCYSKKPQALRLHRSWKGRSRSPCRTKRAHAGLTFFCQAARLGGLSNEELVRLLRRLHKAGAPRAGRDPREGSLSRTCSQDRPLLYLPPAGPPQVRAAPTLRYLT